MSTPRAPRQFWEDFPVGDVRDFGGLPVTREAVLEFARQFDPQPFHVDEDAARESLFGGLCASGWHTCALAMKLTVENFLREAASMGSPGLESLRWLKPVFANDTLRLRQSVVESRALRSRPDVGLVRSRWEMFNQGGEKVMQMEGYGMFRRRHRATEQELAQLDASKE